MMNVKDAVKALNTIKVHGEDQREGIKLAVAALNKQDAINCKGCSSEEKEGWEEPCRHCMRQYHDYWRKKK